MGALINQSWVVTDGSHARDEMQIRLKSFSNICLPFFLIYDIQIVRIIHRDGYFQVLILIILFQGQFWRVCCGKLAIRVERTIARACLWGSIWGVLSRCWLMKAREYWSWVRFEYTCNLVSNRIFFEMTLIWLNWISKIKFKLSDLQKPPLYLWEKN